MQLNSPTMGLYACVVLLLVQDSIPVAVDTLEEEDILAVVDIPVVVEGNLAEQIPVAVDTLEEEDILVMVQIPVVVEGNLADEHSLGVDNLEMAFAALLSRIVVARVDQD